MAAEIAIASTSQTHAAAPTTAIAETENAEPAATVLPLFVPSSVSVLISAEDPCADIIRGAAVMTVQHQWCVAVMTNAKNEDADPVAVAPPPCEQDYACPICLDLLLRPVKLACGHRFCRGCWIRVLQSHDGRATAHLTGVAACPFRCEVRPVVPEVDQALASELESTFVEQYSERAAAYALPDEQRKAAEVNAWAAAGCKLMDSTPMDFLATMAGAVRTDDETLTARRAARRLAQREASEARRGALQMVNLVTSIVAASLVVILGVLLLCVIVAAMERAQQTSERLLMVLREFAVFSAIVLTGLSLVRMCAQRHAQRAERREDRSV